MTFLLKSIQILTLLTIIAPASWGRGTVQVADIFSEDLFVEVNHLPFLVDSNLL